jgi:PAS domain S-box-containing protein
MATLMVVDDRPSNREFLTTLLGYGGHRLLEAGDGAEALALARMEHPDLVIADILMPTMDGYEFVRQLRSDPTIQRTRVIFCTAHCHEEEARALARACGVCNVLTKPCEPELVLSTVQEALGLDTPSTVSAPPTEEFDREHVRLMSDKLLENANALRKANDRLAALVDLGLQLGSERDPRRLLHSFCPAARSIIGAQYAIVGIVDEDGSHLRYLFTSGMDAEAAARLGSPDPRESVLRTVLAQCRCARLHNPGGDPVAIGFSASYPPIQSWLGAPIVAPSGVFGWLVLINKIGMEPFSKEDERLAGILAAQVGRTYENGSMYEDIQRYAAELEQAQHRLRNVLASSPAVLYTLAIKGEDPQLTWISENVRDLLGYAVEEVFQPNWWRERVHPEDLSRVLARLQHELFEQRHRADEYRFRNRDGVYRWIRCEMRLLQDAPEGSGEVVGSWSDITERKHLEDQFRQAQKMEAVGRLAGGVAHDFNNLLTIINGYGEVVLGGLPADDPTRALIREVLAAGKRAAGLTRQLLAFSRKTILEPKVLDLNAVVADVDKMLRRILGEDIQMAVVADPEAGAVKADPGQIEQVLLNLVVNARDAMPQGGRLTIEVRNVDLDETYARDHAEVRPGPHVMLAVTDTGCGMDAATMARIWEPFFSTKGERGTGLGLATVYGIIKQSGGHVAVYSELGRGTTFKVYLPCVDKRPLPVKSSTSLAVMPRGHETVLLVEDADGVRALARHILRSCGYTILEASDGVEAVRLAEQHGKPIDLLVTDVVMPRMAGREVAERLAALHTGVKVLFLSGYTDDAVVRHGILEAQVAFLQKPFSPAALATKVREVLDQPEPPARASREEAVEGNRAEGGLWSPIHILLVDDHSILRTGIRKMLQKLPGVEVVAEAGDGREALALVGDHHPDIVFMDIAMEGLNGLEATARLTKEAPDVRVIMLSMHADEEHVWKALRAGAAGYLLKHADAAEVQLALQTVARGGSYVTSAVSQHIVAEFIRRGGTEASSVELLTSRQREILQLLAEGKTVKEIARLLAISVKTVETHRTQIMERLDIHDLAGLVRYAIRVGLIQSDT